MNNKIKAVCLLSVVMPSVLSAAQIHLHEASVSKPVGQKSSWRCFGASCSVHAVLAPEQREKEISEIADPDDLDLQINLPERHKDDAIASAKMTGRSADSATASLTLPSDRSDQSQQSLQSSEFLNLSIREKPTEKVSTLQYFRQMFNASPSAHGNETVVTKKLTPLQKAVAAQNLKEVLKLVRSGQNVGVLTPDRNNLLHLAIKSIDATADAGHVLAIVTLLIDQGVDVMAKNKQGQTPLHCAVQSLNLDLVEMLVSYKQLINMQDDLGNTPLMTTINRFISPVSVHRADLLAQQAQVIKALIDAGSDLGVRNQAGRLPADDANYQIKEHGMLPQVADYIHNAYTVINKRRAAKMS